MRELRHRLIYRGTISLCEMFQRVSKMKSVIVAVSLQMTCVNIDICQ